MTETSLQVIKPITTEEKELIELANSYTNLVVTKDTLKQVDLARKTLKAKRLEIERTVEANKKAVKQLLKNHEEEGQRLVGIIEPIEARLMKEQKALEEKEAAELKAKLEAEENRKRQIKARITYVESMTSGIRIGSFDAEIERVQCPEQKDSFEEYNEEGNAAIDSFVLALQNRKAHLQDVVVKASAANTPAQPEAQTEREQQLVRLGFVRESHAWTHQSGTRIPFIMLDIKEEAWDSMLQPLHHNPKQNKSPETAKPDFNALAGVTPKPQQEVPKVQPSATPAQKEPDMNVFKAGEYWIGIDKSVPFNKVAAVRKAIIETLNK
jgi:hypothetical protein